MSRNPNQAHKKLDPLTREKHKRMVKDFIERNAESQREDGLEIVITLTAQRIQNNLFNQHLISRELKALAGLLKRNGKTRDDFMDAVMWMEDRIGVKLLPKKAVH